VPEATDATNNALNFSCLVILFPHLNCYAAGV